MSTSVFQTALYALGGGILGAVCAWLVLAVISRRHTDRITNAALAKLDSVTVQKNLIAEEYSRSQTKIESLQGAIAERSADLKSLHKKSKLLAKNVLMLRSERENTKVKLGTLQNALGPLKQQTAALQSEFEKSQEFYKRELVKSLEKRKLLEKKIKEARTEQEAFANLVETSTLEHGSTENMIVAAQLRLGQLKMLERNINKLEAENAQLRRDAIQTKQELELRARDLAELEELKINNKQLVRCVEALEDSRKEHETDAEEYRQQAVQSEQLSDTLRLKLDDLEKNFADIEKQQDEVLESARKAAVVPMRRNQR